VRASSATALLLLTLLGCPPTSRVVDLRPDTGQPSQPDDSAIFPSISVSASSVDFGSVGVGEHHEKSLVIVNVGDGTLSIEEAELSAADSPFSVEQLEQPLLASDAQTDLVLAFEPVTHGPVNGTLIIRSDDPMQPTVSVDLNGEGVAPALQVEPTELSLGPTLIGCEASARLTLYNTGNEGLLINAVEFEVASDELVLELAEVTNGPLPWSLAADADLDLGIVTHTPVDDRSDAGYLIIGSADSRVEDLRVDVGGEALAWAEATDSFTVPTGVVDVVIVVDRSTSMDVHLGGVLDGLPVLVAGLVDRGLDLQLAAVVDDDGCVNGALPWLDASHSSGEVSGALAEMVATDGGSTLTERAFLLLQAVFEVDNLASGGCNEGLLRTGSALHLVGVSDEPEQSPGSWSDHLASLQGLRADPDLLVLHAISGDDAGCGDAPFDGFSDAVDATGGGSVSLCSEDLAGDLDALAGVMAGVAGEPESEGPYALAQVPVAASIVVQVDGTTQLEGWSYDPGGNSIDFEPAHAPSPGALVEVGYAVQPDDCSQP
jgi:hypothetical protein